MLRRVPIRTQHDPTGRQTGERKAARGGSSYSAPDGFQTAVRSAFPLVSCLPNVGFGVPPVYPVREPPVWQRPSPEQLGLPARL